MANSVIWMTKVERKGTEIFFLDDNNCLQLGIFISYTNISHRKATILPEDDREITIASEKIIWETAISAKTKADRLDSMKKRYDKRKREKQEMMQ